MFSSLFYVHLSSLYIDPKDSVLTNIFKTSFEVPSIILLLFFYWNTEERQDGEEKTSRKGIKLKCHIQKWW